LHRPIVSSQTGKQTLSLIVSGTAITSRQLYKGTAPASIPTEAALLIDDCTVNTGTSSTGASCAPSGTYLGGNPIQGFLQADGTMLFSGITLPADGNPFTIRVTNIRVNANELTAGAFVTGTVMPSFPVQNQSGLVLGAVLNSLSLTVSAVTPFSQCASIPAAGTVVQTVTVKELFKTAFKSQGTDPPDATPGKWYRKEVNTESQTVLDNVVFKNDIDVVPGQAGSGTRIRLNFSNIPAGWTLTLPVYVGDKVHFIQATTGGDNGLFKPAASAIVLTKAGSVTYEVMAQQGREIDYFTIPVTINNGTPSSTPGVYTTVVSAIYAPTTKELPGLNNPFVGVPQFADTSTPAPFATVAACQTTLLFPYVANVLGYDSGIAISNTTARTDGTQPEAGVCTINYFQNPGVAPSSQTTNAVIPAGGTLAFTLNGGGNYGIDNRGTGFNGYIIAQCSFDDAHGFGYLSQFGNPYSGLSYLAVVLPNSTRIDSIGQ
jgi:hypothetical protein